MHGTLKEYGRLIRVEYCGLSLIAAIGALSAKGREVRAWDVLILVLINVITVIWGFVHNDYVDMDIDKRSKEVSNRPLAKETISTRAALALVVACMIIAPTTAVIGFRNPMAVLILIVSGTLAFLYNLLGKKVVGADVLYAASAALLCLFGAVAVCGPQALPRGIPPLTWFIVGLTFSEHWFFNAVPGGLKDIENDRQSGARTIAVCLSEHADTGTRLFFSFKALVLANKGLTLALAFAPFVVLRIESTPLQLAILLVIAWRALALTHRLLNADFSDRRSLGRTTLRVNVVSNALVPVVLVGFIGIAWTLFLVLLPFLWFAAFNYVLYKDVFTLPRTF